MYFFFLLLLSINNSHSSYYAIFAFILICLWTYFQAFEIHVASRNPPMFVIILFIILFYSIFLYICIFMFLLHFVYYHYLNCFKVNIDLLSNNNNPLSKCCFFLFPPSISRIRLCWGILRQTLPHLFWYQSSEAEREMFSEVDME